MTTAYSGLQREAFSLPNEILVLDPDEAVSLGEDGNVDRFGDSFVLIGSHPLEKGGQADKGFRHLGEVLSRQGGHGRHEGPVIAFQLVADVLLDVLLEPLDPVGIGCLLYLAGVGQQASDLVDELIPTA